MSNEVPMGKLRTGLKATVRRKVSKRMSINRMHKPGADVLSSPSMIQLMELTAINATQAHLPKGYTTVGYHVDVRHIAPTSIGQMVEAHAEVIEIDRNRLTFAVETYEGEKKIGQGTHKRAVIQIPE